MSWTCPYQDGEAPDCLRVGKPCRAMQPGCMLEEWSSPASPRPAPPPDPSMAPAAPPPGG